MTEQEKRKNLQLIEQRLDEIQDIIDNTPDDNTQLDSLFTDIHYDIQDIRTIISIKGS